MEDKTENPERPPERENRYTRNYYVGSAILIGVLVLGAYAYNYLTRRGQSTPGEPTSQLETVVDATSKPSEGQDVQYGPELPEDFQLPESESQTPPKESTRYPTDLESITEKPEGKITPSTSETGLEASSSKQPTYLDQIDYLNSGQLCLIELTHMRRRNDFRILLGIYPADSIARTLQERVLCNHDLQDIGTRLANIADPAYNTARLNFNAIKLYLIDNRDVRTRR